MKISDDDITKMLAELPEIELPNGFHEEIMKKVRPEHRRGELRSPANKKNRRTIWYIGSFATAAAVMVAFMITVLDFGQNQWAYGDLMSVADVAPFVADTEDMDIAMEIMEIAEMPIAQFAAPEAAMGRMDVQVESEGIWNYGRIWSEDDEWAQAVSTSVFPYPDHLPTDLLDFELAEYFASTFEITIRVDDLFYAQEAIHGLGTPQDDFGLAIKLQPDFADLEATFIALYALGIVEEYRITMTNTLALSNMQQIFEALESANTIFITLLQDVP